MHVVKAAAPKQEGQPHALAARSVSFYLVLTARRSGSV